MSTRFFARAALFISLAVATVKQAAGLRLTSADLQNRALTDITQNTLFTPANSTGIFILINVDGQDVPVQVDLASGDLYVAGQINGDELAATSTEALAQFDFLQPPVSGSFPIKLGVPVSIGGQKIEQPIILDPNPNKGLQQAFADNQAAGVLGFGSSPISAVVNGLKQGRSPLDEVYSHLVTSTSAFSTILYTGFDESTPSTLEFSGLFTIGRPPVALEDFFPGSTSLGPDFSAITTQPAIELGASNDFKISKLTVNGADTAIPSSTTGLITTTSLFSVAPIDTVQALYSKIPGGWLNQGSGTYYLPCAAEVNATITIDPMTSAIPLDPATLVIRNPANSSECVGSFIVQKAAKAPTTFSLGLSFLPNAYLLTGYRDSALRQPIYRLLPLTNTTDAHDYFVSTRTGSGSSWPQYTSYPGSSSSPSSSSSSPSTSEVKVAGSLEDVPDDDHSNSDSLNLPSGSVADKLKHCLPAIIVVAILVGVLAVGGAIFALIRRHRSGSRHQSAYRNIHISDNMDSSKGLYAHDEESASKYSDPYHDSH